MLWLPNWFPTTLSNGSTTPQHFFVVPQPAASHTTLCQFNNKSIIARCRWQRPTTISSATVATWNCYETVGGLLELCEFSKEQLLFQIWGLISLQVLVQIISFVWKKALNPKKCCYCPGDNRFTKICLKLVKTTYHPPASHHLTIPFRRFYLRKRVAVKWLANRNLPPVHKSNNKCQNRRNSSAFLLISKPSKRLPAN